LLQRREQCPLQHPHASCLILQEAQGKDQGGGSERVESQGERSGVHVQKERESLHELTNSAQCFKPAPELIGEINQQLRGWKNYFSIGNPQGAYWGIDWYVRERLIQHLQRRSQRGLEFPKDRTIYQWFKEQCLIALSGCQAKRHIL
jgi:hypothetical protein